MRERKGAHRDLEGTSNGKSHLNDIGVDGKILKWILKKPTRKAWTGLISLSCEPRNEPLGSIKYGEFFD